MNSTFMENSKTNSFAKHKNIRLTKTYFGSKSQIESFCHTCWELLEMRRVVKTLCSTIRESAVTIIVDRFFTSVTLLQTLPFSCVGTVMSNRKNLPDMTGKLQRGDSKAKCTNDGLICYKWQDTKEVTLLSNFHKHVIGTADRRQNDCPAAICFYNEHMAGVDKADQYSTIYTIDRKSNKWWKRVFHRLLMVAVSNAWILYKQFREKQMPLINFLVPLAEDLIDTGESGTRNRRNVIAGRPPKRSKPMVNVAHQRIKGATKRRCKSVTVSKVIDTAAAPKWPTTVRYL